jgi:hypothetical protein
MSQYTANFSGSLAAVRTALVPQVDGSLQKTSREPFGRRLPAFLLQRPRPPCSASPCPAPARCRAACVLEPSLNAAPAAARGPRRVHTFAVELEPDFSLDLLPLPALFHGGRKVLVGPGASHLLVPVAPSAQSTPGDPHGWKLSTGGPANRGVGLSTRRSVTNGQRRHRSGFRGSSSPRPTGDGKSQT